MVRRNFLGIAFLAANVVVGQKYEGRHLRDLQVIETDTVDDIVIAQADLTTLALALQTAGLVDIICPGTCNYTLFAPIDAAFAAVDQDYLAKLLTPSWITHLRRLLGIHIPLPAPERVLSSELRDVILPTLSAEELIVTVVDSAILITSEYTNGSQVIEADLIASNGVVHKVDSVFVPQFLVTDLVEFGSTLVGSSTFSILYDFIPVLVANGYLVGDFTIFAPHGRSIRSIGE